MSSFIVSARKYRPSQFKDVVGQGTVTTTLKNAIKNDKVAQSFLFCGPRGVGKTTCARILAKALNCQNLTEQAEPCGTCEACQSFQKAASFNIFELDAASNNSVDDIRNLIEQVRFAPQSGKYKIYIIDEVHMLSQAAFNAFLKTLEEPPSYAVFILATTEKHKIIPTILSRCQIFDFGRISVKDMVEHLKFICEDRQITADDDALHIIAQKADGALRDSLSIFDRISSFTQNNITYDSVVNTLNILDYDYYFKVTDALLIQDTASILLLFNTVLQKGFEGDHFINGLAEHFRNLLVCKNPATLSLLEVSENLQQRYLTQAAITPSSFLLSCLNIANHCDINYKMSKNKRLQVELNLLKMCYALTAINLSKQALPNSSSTVKKNTPSLSQLPVSTKRGSEEAKKQGSEEAKKQRGEEVKKRGSEEVKKRKGEEASQSSRKPENQTINKQTDEHTNRLVKQSSSPPAKSFLARAKASKLGSSKPKAASGQPANQQVSQPTYQKTNQPVAISQQQLRQVWDSYAMGIEEKGTQSMFKQAKIMLANKTIEVTVPAKIWQTNIFERRSDFIAFLNNKVGYTGLTLSIEVDKSQQVATNKRNKPYFDKEKFEAMAKENPVLLTLQKKFNLSY